MRRLRHLAAPLLALALLVPALGAVLSCATAPGDTMAAMRCCQKMHSTCMKGEHAGAMACCQKVAPASAALWVAFDHSAPATTSVALLQTAAARTQALALTPLPGASPPLPPGSALLLTRLRV